MKLALLAHNLRGGGGSALARDVIANLVRLASQHEIVVTALKGFGYDFLREIPNVELYEYEPGGWLERYRIEKEVAQYLNDWGCDWAWWLGNMGIIFPKCRQSVYIRNAYTVNYPMKNWGVASLRFRAKLKFANVFVRRTLKRCSRAYVQTETMRTRLLQTYRFLKEENVGICVAPPLFKSRSLKPSQEIVDLMRDLKVKDESKFRALYVSMINPHKNMERVIDMFQQYRNELKDVVLYVTASKDSGYQAKLWNKIEAAGLTESIRFLGTFPQTDVPALFDVCDVVFFPTLLETVGHGHNDALFFERPLIASDLDFAHEICGDAAYFINPFSAESMKNGILTLKNDPDLRKELVEKGKRRVNTEVPSFQEIISGVLTEENIPFAPL